MRKTIEALGYRWTFSTNSADADTQREQLERDANKCALSRSKPSEKKTVFQLLGGFYPDIMSSLESLESLEPENGLLSGEGLVLDLMYFPERWVMLAYTAYRAGEYSHLHALLAAARECNPHWEMDKAPTSSIDEEWERLKQLPDYIFSKK